MSYPQPSSIPFREYAKRLVRLHQLILANNDDSEEADTIRDEMDVYWYRMSPQEIEWAGKLSEDLYATEELRELGLHTPASPEYVEAYQEQQWDRVLDILRQKESNLPSDLVAFVRGTCWAQMHFPDVANEFFRAIRRHRELTTAELIWFVPSLLVAGGIAEALDMLPVLEPSSDPKLVLLAAEVLSIAAQKCDPGSARDMLERSVILARSALIHQAAPDEDELWRRMRLSALLHMAFSLESLGKVNEAEAACLTALKIDARSTHAYALLGFLRSGDLSDAERAEVRNEIQRNLQGNLRPEPLAA